MLNQGLYKMEDYKAGGWVTDLKYEDEVQDLLKKRTGGKEDEVQKVSVHLPQLPPIPLSVVPFAAAVQALV